jgi:hypothetical protein
MTTLRIATPLRRYFDTYVVGRHYEICGGRVTVTEHRPGDGIRPEQITVTQSDGKRIAFSAACWDELISAGAVADA